MLKKGVEKTQAFKAEEYVCWMAGVGVDDDDNDGLSILLFSVEVLNTSITSRERRSGNGGGGGCVTTKKKSYQSIYLYTACLSWRDGLIMRL